LPAEPVPTSRLIESFWKSEKCPLTPFWKLGRAQPEFHDDWTSIYQTWDGDPANRILKLDLVPWPGMSNALEHAIKSRGVQK
jgi:hypothetical protein